jgi:hypothetical protein
MPKSRPKVDEPTSRQAGKSDASRASRPKAKAKTALRARLFIIPRFITAIIPIIPQTGSRGKRLVQAGHFSISSNAAALIAATGDASR